MRSMLYSIALGAAAVVAAAGTANAAPAVGTNPAAGASSVQTVQDFDIYIGPRYGYSERYRGYGYDSGYGYGYGYNPGYYYAPGRDYYDGGYGYRSERRPFRRLQRQAP